MNLYVWGSNKYKQISSKEKLHVYSPTQNTDFEDYSPSKVATGDNHTIVLTDFGDVLSFGRGREGQLGHGEKSDEAIPKIVNGLNHETVVDVACGSLTSYAITSSGRVYQWGLVHKSANGSTVVDADEEDHAAAAGELTGLAQDQDNFAIAYDAEARRAQAEAQGVEGRAGENTQQGGPGTETRMLRSIVRDSTERWMLATDGADQEFYRELKAMGYENEEVNDMLQQKGKEYNGMLKLGCRRNVQSVPELVRSVQNLRVVSVSAGYAHCMMVTENGQLYAAGYNDRGQLGLGHRISTSEFKWVDFLAARFVVQVICGQQHTLCRAVERSSASAHGASLYVGSSIGADAFSWGNGILGQLGLGRRGTTKGRLLPTLIPQLHEDFPSGIIHVAAGHMFSVAVTTNGKVYSWGHAEYNQHGTGGSAASDYTDPYHFFSPRLVRILKRLPDPTRRRGPQSGASTEESSEADHVQIVSVSCGSNFSMGIDTDKNLYSWGWNESAVLGLGIAHFTSEPVRVPSLSSTNDGSQISTVATGSKHCLALTSTPGSRAAGHFRYLLETSKFADVEILVDTGASYRSFLAHRVVLDARSSYFRGYLKASLSDTSLNAPISDPSEDEEETPLFTIDLTDCTSANAVTMTALLEYIYLDRVNIVNHKRQQLAELATTLCVTRLVNLLGPAKERGIFALATGGEENHLESANPSTFAEDMLTAMNSSKYADVVFIANSSQIPAHIADSTPTCIYAHKAVLYQMGYFEGLLCSQFRELMNTATYDVNDVEPGVLTLPLDGFIADGIEVETFINVLKYAYAGTYAFSRSTSKQGPSMPAEASNAAPAGDDNRDSYGTEMKAANGEESKEDADVPIDEGIQNTMSMLMAANRFGFTRLAMVSERELTMCLLLNFPHNAEACLEFARSYNLVRLERQCVEALRTGAKKTKN